MRRVAAAVAAVMLSSIGVAVAGSAPVASAQFWRAGMDFWVMSSTMGPIKARVFRAHDGNTHRVVYALDGMRARPDLNGWEIETDIAQTLTAQNINVVMPVGGMSSFYSDWLAPSNFGLLGTGSASISAATGSAANTGSAGYPHRAGWETFLTSELPNALHARLGFASTRNGIFGLSMGGSAALTLAAYHPNQFSYAGAFSGFLNPSAPGMPEIIRLAMLDAGNYNADDMWGPPWSPDWLRNDPFVFAPLLKAEHIRLFIASGNGLPGPYDHPQNLADAWYTTEGMGLESLALANTGAFRARLNALGYDNVDYFFPPYGVHNWPYWVNDVNQMIPDMSAHIG
jgi:diacylglycerol O-acyltransferase/trehalose O-mycolyltransferase